jgi:hypothetical protein
MSLGFGLPLLLMPGENANDRRAHHLGIIDPLLRLGDLGLTFFAGRMAELVADRRAGDIEPQPERVPR